METDNNIIDDHLIHNSNEGIGRMQSIIRTTGILAIIAAVLTILGIFQQLFSIGQQFFQMLSSSFDQYMAYSLSNIFTGAITIILEIVLSIYLFRFGLVAMNAGKKVLGQEQWDDLFKSIRNIMITTVGLILGTLFSNFVNILLNFILG